MEEGALTGMAERGVLVLFGPKITRERWGGGGGGGCSRASYQDPPQLSFLTDDHELSFWKSSLNVGDFYDPVPVH